MRLLTRIAGRKELVDAVRAASVERVRQLLESGVSPNRRSKSRAAALHVAAEHGHREIAGLLAEHGADLDIRDEAGWTPLRWAAHKGHVDVIALLLDRGAEVDSRDLDGRTPLHWAAASGMADAAAMLFRHGAVLNTGDSQGMTPLDWAVRGGHMQTAHYLRAWGGIEGPVGTYVRRWRVGSRRRSVEGVEVRSRPDARSGCVLPALVAMAVSVAMAWLVAGQ